jgi:hypothetical protein
MDRGEVGEGWVPYHSFLTDIFAGVHIERATASVVASVGSDTVEPRNKNENRRPRAI